MNEILLDSNGDTIAEAILRWLEANPSLWYTRSEIAHRVGRSKTSQLVRVIENLVRSEYIMKQSAREHGREVFIYSLNVNPSDSDLPF